MEEFNLQRIRDLIIAAHSVSDDGTLTFDTSKVESLGFTKLEMDETDRILAAEQDDSLQDYIKSQIKFCFGNPTSFSVYHLGYAKLIFSVNHQKQAYSYITEEELEQRVREMRDFTIKLQYIEANSNNDAYGNPI